AYTPPPQPSASAESTFSQVRAASAKVEEKGRAPEPPKDDSKGLIAGAIAGAVGAAAGAAALLSKSKGAVAEAQRKATNVKYTAEQIKSMRDELKPEKPEPQVQPPPKPAKPPPAPPPAKPRKK